MTQTTDQRKATLPCPACGRANRVSVARLDNGPRCGHCGTPLTTDRPVEVSDRTFGAVTGGPDLPVIVDFYADWCGPCKTMAPLLDQIARERIGQVVVAKLDTDQNQQTAGRFGIRGIPTVIGFVGGREVAREVGAVPKQRLDMMVASLLQNAG